MKEFVINEIKSISAVQSKCHICGFENPKEEIFRVCPMCNTDLVVKTAVKGEPFGVSFTFG